MNETVFFEYTDASGMSQRTTDKNGVEITGDGGEGSPIETDPLGGNVGTSNPYFELPAGGGGYEPPQEYPQLLEIFGDSPQYVNGQRVTCSLDGFAIGCSQAFDLLDHGSAIPAALAPYQGLPGFQFNSYGNGIFTVTIPRQVGWNVTYNGDNDTRGTAHPVYSGSNTYSFNLPSINISWAPPQQGFNLGSKGVAFTSGEKASLKKAFEYVNTKKCLDWINTILEKTIGPWDEGGQKGNAPFALSAQDLLSKVTLNRYSSALTADQMGFSQQERDLVTKNENRFVGVTKRGTAPIFLAKLAFYQPGALTSLLISGTDLPASIVHEMFHSFGLEDPYVQSLSDDIQKNCGWGGKVGD